MPITRLLIANRGEIAIRIGRAAADLGLRSVAVHSRDDARSLHVPRRCAKAGLIFVGRTPKHLELFGDKAGRGRRRLRLMCR